MFKNGTGKHHMKGPLGVCTMAILSGILHEKGAKVQAELGYI
jgi:hypothetical protein